MQSPFLPNMIVKERPKSFNCNSSDTWQSLRETFCLRKGFFQILPLHYMWIAVHTQQHIDWFFFLNKAVHISSTATRAKTEKQAVSLNYIHLNLFHTVNHFYITIYTLFHLQRVRAFDSLLILCEEYISAEEKKKNHSPRLQNHSATVVILLLSKSQKQ